MGKALSTEPGTQNILKTMMVAIVIIISILVIPEGRQHWALGQRGYGAFPKMPQGPAATHTPISSLNSYFSWYWALSLPLAPSPLLRTPLLSAPPLQ